MQNAFVKQRAIYVYSKQYSFKWGRKRRPGMNRLATIRFILTAYALIVLFAFSDLSPLLFYKPYLRWLNSLMQSHPGTVLVVIFTGIAAGQAIAGFQPPGMVRNEEQPPSGFQSRTGLFPPRE